ncbi:hypothetical protein [Nostoc sp.]
MNLAIFLKNYSAIAFTGSRKMIAGQANQIDFVLDNCATEMLVGVTTCNTNRSNLQSRHFQTRIICNYNYPSARINCN